MIAAAIKVPCDTIQCETVATDIIEGSKYRRMHSHEAGVKAGALESEVGALPIRPSM